MGCVSRPTSWARATSAAVPRCYNARQMSMGVMGITAEELIDGISFGGVATYLEDASDSKLTLFI